MDDVRRLADAVLYEGYLLWPYRRSAVKNQRRWTFGAVLPEGHCRDHSDDRSVLRAQCLLHLPAPVSVTVRFLHVVVCDDQWEEAVEREVSLGPLGTEALLAGCAATVRIAAGRQDGRRWEALEGAVAVRAQRVDQGALRLELEVANRTAFAGGPREAALRRAFCSTHAMLHAPGGRFASLADPPAELAQAAAGCANDGLWPVLVGAPEQDDTVLASPIILEDHPRIAPESPGDLFDGGEIDQLLTLSILSLTDEEKAQMRECDPRARAILERTEALTPAQLLRLHAEMQR